MTVSTSIARRRTIGKVLRRAAHLAGVLEPHQSLKTADRELLRELLEDILDGLQAEGVSARARVFDTITVTAAQVTAETYKFDLGTNVLGVVDDGQWITSANTDTDRASDESLVKLVGYQTWHKLANKSTTSDRPTLMYEHRENDTIQVWLWQIPSDAGTLRVPVERHLSDVDDDNATLDLQPYWYRAITHELADDYRQSQGLPVEEQALGHAKANRLKRRALGKSKDNVDLQISIRR